MNLHVHVHAVVSDGAFGLDEDGHLSFYPMPTPDAEAVHELMQRVRRKVLKRLARMGAMPRETVRDMLAWSRPI